MMQLLKTHDIKFRLRKVIQYKYKYKSIILFATVVPFYEVSSYIILKKENLFQFVILNNIFDKVGINYLN